MDTRALDSGLARERTSLAWTRTCLAAVANGVLVVVRHERAFSVLVATCLAGLSMIAVVATVVQAIRRSAVVRERDDQIAAPTRSVMTVGVALLALCIATSAAIIDAA